MENVPNKDKPFIPSRVDENQPALVAEFRRLGCSVQHTHFYGDGFPDIIVGVAGFNLLVEIKNGKKPPSARKKTAFQGWWHLTWQGQAVIVKDEEEVRQLVAAVRRFAREIVASGIAPLPSGDIVKLP